MPMTDTTDKNNMRIVFRGPFEVCRTNLYRRWNSTAVITMFVAAYVCLFLIDAGRILTSVTKPPKGGSTVTATSSDGHSMVLDLSSLSKKMKAISDSKKLNKLDLSVPVKNVRFRTNRRKLLCLEWEDIKDDVEKQVRDEEENAPLDDDEPTHDTTGNQIVPNLFHILGSNRDAARTRSLEAKSKNATVNAADEPGLQKPVSPRAAVLKALYRRALAHAIHFIKNTMEDEPVTSCAFPGFSQSESQQIWEQGARQVRIRHTCSRYPAFLYPTNASSEVIWDPSDNLGYCHQMDAGPNTWMKLLLEWGGEKEDPETAVDDARAEVQLSQLYPPLQGWRKRELESQKPLLFTTLGHPFERLVSTYVNHIKRHYRYESSKVWIQELRGLTFQEVMKGIRKAIYLKSPALARRGTLNTLLAPPEGFGKHNTVRRNTNSTDTRLNFREFVWLAIKQNLECFNEADCLAQVDPHWRPQYIWCSPCSLNFDYIIKDESFKEDSNLMLKLLGKPILPEHVPTTTSSPVSVSKPSENSNSVNTNQPPSVSKPLQNSSSSTPLYKSSQNAGSPTNLADVRTEDSNNTVVDNKHQVPIANVTGNVNGFDNKNEEVKPKTVPETDYYNLVESDDSSYDNLSLEDLSYEYLSYLTNEEISILYIAYTYDFTLFGYTTKSY